MKDNLTYKAKKLFHSLLNKAMARTYLKQTTCNEYMQTVYKAMSLQTLKQENIFDLFLKISSNQRKKPTFSSCTDGLKNTSKRIYRILAMNNDSLM